MATRHGIHTKTFANLFPAITKHLVPLPSVRTQTRPHNLILYSIILKPDNGKLNYFAQSNSIGWWKLHVRVAFV